MAARWVFTKAASLDPHQAMKEAGKSDRSALRGSSFVVEYTHAVASLGLGIQMFRWCVRAGGQDKGDFDIVIELPRDHKINLTDLLPGGPDQKLRAWQGAELRLSGKRYLVVECKAGIVGPTEAETAVTQAFQMWNDVSLCQHDFGNGILDRSNTAFLLLYDLEAEDKIFEVVPQSISKKIRTNALIAYCPEADFRAWTVTAQWERVIHNKDNEIRANENEIRAKEDEIAALRAELARRPS